jgi:hemerythrin
MHEAPDKLIGTSRNWAFEQVKYQQHTACISSFIDQIREVIAQDAAISNEHVKPLETFVTSLCAKHKKKTEAKLLKQIAALETRVHETNNERNQCGWRR